MSERDHFYDALHEAGHITVAIRCGMEIIHVRFHAATAAAVKVRTVDVGKREQGLFAVAGYAADLLFGEGEASPEELAADFNICKALGLADILPELIAEASVILLKNESALFQITDLLMRYFKPGATWVKVPVAKLLLLASA